jgi:Arc/MetJ-type ribon-helix-helix transcriptional regulator
MKTLTVRLPEAVVARIEAESRRRGLSKSDVVRERLTAADANSGQGTTVLDEIADLVGSVDGLPGDLSAKTKKYLKSTGYGVKRPR